MPTVVCPSNADVTLFAILPDSNYGSYTADQFGMGNEMSKAERALMRFDLSSIPVGVIILNAKMELYFSGLSNDTARDAKVHGNTQAWGEFTATWNNQPTNDAVATATTSITVRYVWYEWDITSLVQQWYMETRPNYGVKILGVESEINTLKAFRTRDYTIDPSLRPKLTITHSYPAPDPPTSLSPSSNARINANQNNNFTWTHNGHGDTQSAYQLQIFRVSDGATIVDTGKVVSATSQHTIVAATLTNGVNYQWKVKTWNSVDLGGSYSSLASFYTSQPPVVSITDPPDEGTYNKGLLIVTWGYSDPDSDPQNRYRAILMNALGATLEDSGEVVNANTSHEFATPLGTGIVYRVSVQAWDTTDQSGSALSVFTANFLAPATPLIAVTAQEMYINIDITNPDPVGEEPTVLYNHLYRRKAGETAWQRIAKELKCSTFFLQPWFLILERADYDDYAVASGVTYEYRVVAFGGNLTTASSLVHSETISLIYSAIHPVSEPSAILTLRITERSAPITYDRSQLHYEGRILPVSQFGIRRDVSIPVKIFLQNKQELDALIGVADMREVLCYRDGSGRKEFVTVASLDIQDIKVNPYWARVTFDAVSYSEVV